MTPLFKKLNFKHNEDICILQHPPEFEEELNAMKDFTTIHTRLEGFQYPGFILAFVQSKAEIDRIAKAVDDILPGDSIFWFAYSKKSSRKYDVDINRDAGWDTLTNLGFRPVRAVAIDEDWSTLRFRRSEFVHT